MRLVREPWVREALCAREPVNPDGFHPGRRTPRRDVAAALALCRRCPVRAQCLGDAVARRDPWGIWGGTTEDDRASLLAARTA